MNCVARRSTSVLSMVVVAALLFGAAPAAAEFDDAGGDTIVVTAENRSPGGAFTATRDATTNRTVEPVCAHWRQDVAVGFDGELMYIEVCDAYYHCASERIDDVVSGRTSGGSEGSAYAEFVGMFTGIVAGLIGNFGGSGEVPTNDDIAESLSDLVVENALGVTTNDAALPIMRYCRIGADGPIEVFDDTYDPQFTWGTTVQAEYDIVGETADLLDELEVRLRAATPQIRVVPLLESGHTFVRFPTWFWLDDPVEVDGTWQQSDLATIRIAVRATLDHVVWSLGDDELRCAPDEMRAYVSGSDPTDDVPDCHRIFDETGSFELEATAVYRIEQQIAIRPTARRPWPDAPWTPAARATIEVSSSVGEYGVHELLALNVREEIPLGD